MLETKWNQLEDYIESNMKSEHIPGLSIGISMNGTTIYQNGFGYRDLQNKLPVTPETIFGIASVTKSFTALAILELEQRGLLAIEDPVTKHLPEFKLNGVQDLDSIKIHHLLSHTTGLAPLERKEEINTYQEHLDYLRAEQHVLLGLPGEYFSYCNDSFLLLGAIIERITGKLFRKYITSTLLEPLDLNRSTFSIEELSKFENVSVPYQFNKSLQLWDEVEWPKLGTYETGGGIRSNIVDLLKYGQLYVENHRTYIQKMWQPVYQTNRKEYYGYALQTTPEYAGAYTLVQHGGGQPGVSSNFGFVPEKKLVVAVLTNVGGVSASDIWLAAVKTALNLPLDYNSRIEPVYNLKSSELDALQGEYTSREGGNIKISIESGKLMAYIEYEAFELRASAPDTLVIIKNEKPLHFYFKEYKAWALFNGSRMLVRK